MSERYEALKSDKTIKEGLYIAFLTHTTNALARGRYKNNMKTGWWDFYDTKNKLLQRYDFTKNALLFEAPEDTASNARYIVDDSLKNSPVTTKPIRIGDRYFGFINYLKIFKLPQELRGADNDEINVVLEILVSPYGRLADYKVHLTGYNYNRTLTFNLDLLSEEDKTFLPATINSQPAACRIFLKVFLTPNGDLAFEEK
ncbi:hypothetical protein [Mucilaginibacter ginkgonis]|uniref:Uncharacterized protein n=1 Tax=Mucilaginibacter ginkgonis TaxID=2682091 RepID=A0A6I4I4F3_9SPHI|nr:hypothetical protein [Mucilaginibacter ginkgonis]QQL50677.1 hypothetical protein GO620_004245 [Mucilaginibacter ginkgonis]